MITDISLGQAINFVEASQHVIDKSHPPSYIPSPLTLGKQAIVVGRKLQTPSVSALPSGIEATNIKTTSAYLTISQAKKLVEQSLNIAHQIMDGLNTASSLINVAASTSLTNNNTGITFNGTRLSGIIISSTSKQIIDKIDKLVSSSTINGHNLISSHSHPINIQTTEFGGNLNALPQPMDSIALNLEDINTISRLNAADAKARIDHARHLILLGIQNLEVLQRSLGLGNAELRNFASINLNKDNLSARGTLVDLFT